MRVTNAVDGEVADLARTFDYLDSKHGPDPYPLLRAFRDHCPVVESEALGGYVALTRFDHVNDALRDHGTFSSNIMSIPAYEKPDGVSLAAPLDLDPPEHSRYRRVLLPFFTPQRTATLEPIARASARRLVGALDGAPGCDVVTQFALQMPTVVIAEILGVDGSDYERFTQWIEVIVDQAADDPDEVIRVHTEAHTYLAGLLAERRTKPRDDLLTFLLTAEVDGVPLTEDQQLSTARLLLIAGIDTTANTLANAIWYLAQNPEDRARLVADPSLLEYAVEEFLRLYAPVSVCRNTTEEVEVGGCPIPAGTQVLMTLPSANRDERKFPHAETMDFDRVPNPHIAFGVGVHRCLGAHIARMELRVGLEEWLRAFPDFQLDGGPEAQEWKAGPIRGPKHIKILFPREQID